MGVGVALAGSGTLPGGGGKYLGFRLRMSKMIIMIAIATTTIPIST